MKEKSKYIRVPIYEQSFELVVTDDIMGSQKLNGRMEALKIKKPLKNSSAFVARRKGYFLIMFDKKYISNELVAHEAFHLAHRLAEYIGLEFSKKNHESTAYLLGWIVKVIIHQMRAWKVVV